jgi:hypothetical protein
MPDGVQLVPLAVSGSDSIAAVKGQIRALAGVLLSALLLLLIGSHSCPHRSVTRGGEFLAGVSVACREPP